MINDQKFNILDIIDALFDTGFATFSEFCKFLTNFQ